MWHSGYVYMQPNNPFVIGLTAQSELNFDRIEGGGLLIF